MDKLLGNQLESNRVSWKHFLNLVKSMETDIPTVQVDEDGKELLKGQSLEKKMKSGQIKLQS